jgi:hypothetical protein
MVLAANGITVSEATLIDQARMEPGGTAIEEVTRLAQSYGLNASIQIATADDLRAQLEADRLAIVYLNRRVFDVRDLRNLRLPIREAQVHCVVPIRVTHSSVFFLDPLQPRVQHRSRRRFEAAHRLLEQFCVICEPK